MTTGGVRAAHPSRISLSACVSHAVGAILAAIVCHTERGARNAPLSLPSMPAAKLSAFRRLSSGNFISFSQSLVSVYHPRFFCLRSVPEFFCFQSRAQRQFLCGACNHVCAQSEGCEQRNIDSNPTGQRLYFVCSQAFAPALNFLCSTGHLASLIFLLSAFSLRLTSVPLPI